MVYLPSTNQPSTFMFAVSKYMTNIPKSLSTFSSFQHFGPGPKIRCAEHTHTHTYKPHTYYNAFHGRSSFIDPLLYGLGGEWVDEHIQTHSVFMWVGVRVCYVTHFHFIFTKTLSNFKKLNADLVRVHCTSISFVEWFLCTCKSEHDT